MSAKAAKKFTKNIRARSLTSAEITLFAEVLADEEHNFAAALEELALKKVPNNEVFTLIQKIFDQKLRENHFIEVNEAENFTNAKGVVSEYTPWDTSIEKLHRKYTTLKAEWCKIFDRCKNESVLAPQKEPIWYKTLNPIFSEKNENLHLAEGSEDLLFNLQNDSIDSDFESELTDDVTVFKNLMKRVWMKKGNKMSFKEPPRKPPLMVKKMGSCSSQKKKRC